MDGLLSNPNNKHRTVFGTRPIFGDERVPIAQSSPTERKVQESYIYVAQEYNTKIEKYYQDKKIGRTFDIVKRFKSFKRPTSIRITKAWKVQDAVHVEKQLHTIFKEERNYGEWFLDKDNKLIEKLGQLIKLAKATEVDLGQLFIQN